MRFPPLDNPIWQAANTRQQHLAYGQGAARRYYPEVVPLAAIEQHTPEAVSALAEITAPGERVWLFDDPPMFDLGLWQETDRIPGYQMVLTAPAPDVSRLFIETWDRLNTVPSVELDAVHDAEAMCQLKAIAFPGFFGPRTGEMGLYRGIRIQNEHNSHGELIAMAGQRLALPGCREISAICTHPAHLGHGYAQQLTREIIAAMQADGDIPFLHVAGRNQRALSIYRHMGFTHYADISFVEWQRLPATTTDAPS